MAIKLDGVEKRAIELEAALISNKDDTHVAIEIVGELTEENNKLKAEAVNIKNMIASYELRDKRSPLGALPAVAIGSIGGTLLGMGLGGQEIDRNLVIAGSTCIASSFAFWCIGHYLFKFW